MPVYNERATLASAIKEVLNVDFPCEIQLVVVDDGSTDGTRDLYPSLGDDSRVKVHMHKRNQGKGAAIRTAATVATGDYVIMCDADLEYTPAEIPSLLAPVIAGQARRAWRRLAEVAAGGAVTAVLMLGVYDGFDARAEVPGLTAYWSNYYLPVGDGLHADIRFVTSHLSAVVAYFGLGPVWLAQAASPARPGTAAPRPGP